MKLNDKVYDVLKWVTMIALPALGGFYFVLSEIWGGFPYPTEIVGTISAITALLGTLLGISSHTYHKEQDRED